VATNAQGRRRFKVERGIQLYERASALHAHQSEMRETRQPRQLGWIRAAYAWISRQIERCQVTQLANPRRNRPIQHLVVGVELE